MLSTLKNNRLLTLYLLWTVIVFTFSFGDGLNAEDITHILILIIFAASFLLRRRLFKNQTLHPQRAFIILGVILAALVEGAYMISKPLHPSLLITAGMSFEQVIRNYALDVALTTPAYILIFLTILLFIKKFKYSVWEYAFIMALGQALGDGSAFLLANPGTLLFLPYIMVNYHTMNLMPFLLFGKNIASETGQSYSRWKYALPLIILPVVYIISAALIFTAGAFFGLLK